jgi:hypothetical protein
MKARTNFTNSTQLHTHADHNGPDFPGDVARLAELKAMIADEDTNILSLLNSAARLTNFLNCAFETPLFKFLFIKSLPNEYLNQHLTSFNDLDCLLSAVASHQKTPLLESLKNKNLKVIGLISSVTNLLTMLANHFNKHFLEELFKALPDMQTLLINQSQTELVETAKTFWNKNIFNYQSSETFAQALVQYIPTKKTVGRAASEEFLASVIEESSEESSEASSEESKEESDNEEQEICQTKSLKEFFKEFAATFNMWQDNNYSHIEQHTDSLRALFTDFSNYPFEQAAIALAKFLTEKFNQEGTAKDNIDYSALKKTFSGFALWLNGSTNSKEPEYGLRYYMGETLWQQFALGDGTSYLNSLKTEGEENLVNAAKNKNFANVFFSLCFLRTSSRDVLRQHNWLLALSEKNPSTNHSQLYSWFLTLMGGNSSTDHSQLLIYLLKDQSKERQIALLEKISDNDYKETNVDRLFEALNHLEKSLQKNFIIQKMAGCKFNLETIAQVLEKIEGLSHYFLDSIAIASAPLITPEDGTIEQTPASAPPSPTNVLSDDIWIALELNDKFNVLTNIFSFQEKNIDFAKIFSAIARNNTRHYLTALHLLYKNFNTPSQRLDITNALGENYHYMLGLLPNKFSDAQEFMQHFLELKGDASKAILLRRAKDLLPEKEAAALLQKPYLNQILIQLSEQHFSLYFAGLTSETSADKINSALTQLAKQIDQTQLKKIGLGLTTAQEVNDCFSNTHLSQMFKFVFLIRNQGAYLSYIEEKLRGDFLQQHISSHLPFTFSLYLPEAYHRRNDNYRLHQKNNLDYVINPHPEVSAKMTLANLLPLTALKNSAIINPAPFKATLATHYFTLQPRWSENGTQLTKADAQLWLTLCAIATNDITSNKPSVELALAVGLYRMITNDNIADLVNFLTQIPSELRFTVFCACLENLPRNKIYEFFHSIKGNVLNV